MTGAFADPGAVFRLATACLATRNALASRYVRHGFRHFTCYWSTLLGPGALLLAIALAPDLF